MSRYVDLSNPKIFYNGRDKFGNGIYHIPPDLPTDDVVKRKKGKWVEVTDGICIWKVCDQCGEKPLWNEWRTDRCESNFCPNCGADMREGEK